MNSITDILNQFETKRVLIIGDAMIDAYMWGNIHRMSPEAPVPVVEIEKRESRLGGAANVALNIQSLGATPILFAAIGNDYQGDLFLNLMKEQNLSCKGIQKINDRNTTVKTRIISDNKHVLRVDEERTDTINDDNLSNQLEKMILENDFDVAPARMSAAGRSYFIPVADNDTSANRAKNRRTRIVVLPKLDQFYDLIEQGMKSAN